MGKARVVDPAVKREKALAVRCRKYGITTNHYRELHRAQRGRCAICAVLKRDALVIDHCHRTGAVRGLLCPDCNVMLGWAADSFEILIKGSMYLRDHAAKDPTHWCEAESPLFDGAAQSDTHQQE